MHVLRQQPGVPRAGDAEIVVLYFHFFISSESQRKEQSRSEQKINVLTRYSTQLFFGQNKSGRGEGGGFKFFVAGLFGG